VRHGRPDLWSAGHSRDTPAFPVRIWLAHYQYRSPRQIAARMRSRCAAGRESGSFRHERSQNWGKALGASARQDADLGETMWELRVVPAENLDYDAGDGRLVYREELLRKIPEPGLKSEAVRLARRVPGHLRQRVDGLLKQRKRSRLATRTGRARRRNGGRAAGHRGRNRDPDAVQTRTQSKSGRNSNPDAIRTRTRTANALSSGTGAAGAQAPQASPAAVPVCARRAPRRRRDRAAL